MRSTEKSAKDEALTTYEALEELFDDITDDILNMSDEEILSEVAATEGDPEAIVAEMRERLRRYLAGER